MILGQFYLKIPPAKTCIPHRNQLMDSPRKSEGHGNSGNTKANWKTTCKWVNLTWDCLQLYWKWIQSIHKKKTSAFPKQITPQILSHRPIPRDIISCLIRRYNINITHYINIPLSISCEIITWRQYNNNAIFSIKIPLPVSCTNWKSHMIKLWMHAFGKV